MLIPNYLCKKEENHRVSLNFLVDLQQKTEFVLQSYV